MPNYLLASEWTKVLPSPPPAEAGGLTKLLEKYAREKEKLETDEEVVALEEIAEVALSVKRKNAQDAKIKGYLDKVVKEAQGGMALGFSITPLPASVYAPELAAR